MPTSISSDDARKFFLNVIKNTVKPASGPVQMTIPDISKLKTIVDNVVRLIEAGDRNHWGPRVKDLNDLCKIVLTDEQLRAKGTTKIEIAKGLSSVLAASQASSQVPDGQLQGSAQKRSRDVDNQDQEEQDFIEQQLLAFRKRKKQAATTGTINAAVNGTFHSTSTGTPKTTLLVLSLSFG